MDDIKRNLLDTETIVVGYAMSRLDIAYYIARGFDSWDKAYLEAAIALSRPRDTFKNLRDEFDPVHSNLRQGWHKRTLRPNRRRVLEDLQSISNDALLELIDRILKRDHEAICEAIEALTEVKNVAANVAERLLTGKRAEEFFMIHSQSIVQLAPTRIVDLRQNACGYDFGVADIPALAIEIKGLKALTGAIQFTDREWSEATLRRNDYIVVVIGNLSDNPVPRVIRNPKSVLTARCTYRRSVTAEWHTHVSVT